MTRASTLASQAHLDVDVPARRPVRRRSLSARAASPARCGGARARAGEARGRHAVPRHAAPRARHRRAEFERVRQLDDVIAFARGARARGERPRHLRAPPGTDERLVEVPWVLVAAALGPVLDVGYAFAEPAYIAALIDGGARRARRRRSCRGRGPRVRDGRRRRAGASVPRRLVRPGPRSSRRSSTSAPTTSVYGLAGEPDGSGRTTALRELRRVLRPDGSLLVTVPLGEPGDYGWFRQEDVRGWTRLFTGAGFFVEEQEVYELGPEGWRAAPTFDPTGVVYGARGPAASAVLCAELSPRRCAGSSHRTASGAPHGGASGRRIAGSAGRSRRRASTREACSGYADCVDALGSATGATARSRRRRSGTARRPTLRCRRRRGSGRRVSVNVAVTSSPSISWSTIVPPQGSDALNDNASSWPASATRSTALDHQGTVREQIGGLLVVARVDRSAPAFDDRRGVIGVVTARHHREQRKRR